MNHFEELPNHPVDRILKMEKILIARATGEHHDGDDELYHELRKEFLSNAKISELLPSFVKTYRSLDAFWPFIKNEAGTYAERRQIIDVAFTPLMDKLEQHKNSPSDIDSIKILERFDTESVGEIWRKALERRDSDPEGAITLARTLLEAVIKHILDDIGESYNDKDDLPKLYNRVAKILNMAPNQHAEEPIKMILGGAMTLVNGIGTLRNRLSDSHGRGKRLPVKPSSRHASLSVNTAGAISTFLIETYLESKNSK